MQRVIGLTLLLAMSTSALFTAQELDTVKAACQNLINTDQRNLIAGFVRLIFHDCVGGCNGCVDQDLFDSATQDSPNAGLGRYINVLEPVYNALPQTIDISRADFWAVCSVVALDAGRGAPLNIPMKYGRTDCPGGEDDSDVARDPASSANFPNPRSGLNATIDWCSDTFGLSERECVALLGAHTLGRASTRNSGYDGPWVRATRALDNAYYIVMRDSTWTQNNVGSGTDIGSARWQFETVIGRRNRQVMMLNADMCFLRDIQPTLTGELPNGQDVNTVNFSRTKQYVDEFADDDNVWIAAFIDAFKKMVESGQSNLQEL